MIFLQRLSLPLSLLFFFSFSFAQKNTAPVHPKDNEYMLVWADEFNINGAPDTSKWSYEKGFVRNNELQWYQTDNAVCQNGMLVIEARRENRPNPLYEEGSNDWKKSRKNILYTSSSLNTRKKFSWQYGRFEMRGRIDISKGMWPAWWTLGDTKRWPANGEIDIMEYYRGSLLANIACLNSNGYSAKWYGKKYPTDSLGGAAWASKFHTWRMDWTESEISLFVDDQLLNRVDVDSLFNRDGSGFNPFRQPHYMLLNLAMGGMNGGDPSQTPFPNRFEIDYVRVYQKDTRK
jgi:beta-glucanase (GH16 family)